MADTVWLILYAAGAVSLLFLKRRTGGGAVSTHTLVSVILSTAILFLIFSADFSGVLREGSRQREAVFALRHYLIYVVVSLRMVYAFVKVAAYLHRH